MSCCAGGGDACFARSFLRLLFVPLDDLFASALDALHTSTECRVRVVEFVGYATMLCEEMAGWAVRDLAVAVSASHYLFGG